MQYFKPNRGLLVYLPLVASLCLGLSFQSGSAEKLVEASGIDHDGSNFVIVGDGTDGAVFEYPLGEFATDKESKSPIAVLKVSRAARQNIADEFVSDLEGVAVLEDGQVVILSERLGAIVSSNKVIALYPSAMVGIGGLGMEGVAIDSTRRVAALWEGGYLNKNALPTGQLESVSISSIPFRPLVCLHDYPENFVRACANNHGIISLKVPKTPDPEQAFRAPDLVWGTDSESIIVLLSSANSNTDKFRYKWLQRFALTGEAIGEPINLCAHDILPADVRSGPGGNFEGLGWLEFGKSLILINDYVETATIVAMVIDPWPTTDKTVACDDQ